MFENFKNSKFTPKAPKNPKLIKSKKTCKEASSKKKFRKQTVVRTENINKDIFKK